MPIRGLAANDDEALLELIGSTGATVVGFTTVTMTYPTVRRYAQKLREQAEGDITILLGGVHVTDAPDLPLVDDCFDFSVAGEGEEPVLQICQGVAEGSVRPDIAGVGYHRTDKPYRNARADMDINKYLPRRTTYST